MFSNTDNVTFVSLQQKNIYMKDKNLTIEEIAANKKSKAERDTIIAMLSMDWNIQILLSMKDGPKSNANIKRATVNGNNMISDDVLGYKIAFFMDNGIMEKVKPQPPYILDINGLTTYGFSLLPLIELIRSTGEIHIAKQKRERDDEERK